MRNRRLLVPLVVAFLAGCDAPAGVARGDASPVTVATAPLPTSPVTVATPPAVSASDVLPVDPAVVESAPSAVPPPETSVAAPEPVTTPPPETAPPSPPPDPLPPVAQIETAGLDVQKVTTLDTPVAIAWRAGDPAPYVAGQKGTVWRIDEAAGTNELVLDLSDRVTPFADGSERGLLGLAFGPDGRMYLDFTDLANDTHVVSMAMNATVPDPATEWEVLFVDQPNNGLGHKAGTLNFDAAGHLFVALGDGGGSNGRDAQDPQKLLGTILRITPNGDGPGYTIPPDNPFANDPVVRPEKYVYGFRNPWRFSIDSATGDIWVGDVGNSTIEELDLVPAGRSGMNYGWYWFEGTRQRASGAPEGLEPPVWEYTHETGVAVIAGVVYRGTAIPALRGALLVGDITGLLWALGADGTQRLPVRFKGVAGFGTDPAGEVWMVSIWGAVGRLVPA